jgi:cytochrome c oxidase subunit I+III
MPRRVYTYPAGMGWDTLNLVSTIGAFMLAAGVALFVVDVARRFRMASEDNAGNVWNAGTLEWLPNGNYSNRSIPVVSSRDPLWSDPRLAEQVEQGRWYLPGTVTGGRETIVTHPISAEPQWLLRMPMPGWAPVLGAWFTAAFFLLLTFKLVGPALVCGAIAVGAILHWAWSLDPKPLMQRFDIGGGLKLPAYMSGPQSQAWWAMVVLMLVSASLYGCAVVSYLYLWTVSPQVWPAAHALPDARWPLAVAALLAASSGAMVLADRWLDAPRRFGVAIGGAVACFVAAFAFDLWCQRGQSPTESSHGAMVYLLLSLEGFFGAIVIAMALFALARRMRGLLGSVHRVSFDNARLFWHYAVAQSLVGLALVHGFPRALG